MLKIYNGRSHFWQWDSGQKLLVDYEQVCEVHFHNPGGERAYTVHAYDLDGKSVADVPNILLQSARQINAWVYVCVGDECTIREHSFDVWPRQRPDDYVYIETQAFDTKLDKDQGVENAGKVLMVDEAGNVIPQGVEAMAGEDGGYYTPAVDNETGVLSWTASKADMKPVEDVNVKGPAGPKGDPGEEGPAGAQGIQGPAGKDGVSVTHAWDGTTLTITSASGTTSANLQGPKGDTGPTGAAGAKGDKGDTGAVGPIGPIGPAGPKGDTGATGLTGAKGDKGDPGATGAPGAKGADGVSPTVTVSKSGKVTTITIKDAAGTKTATINDGADGAKGEKGDTGPTGATGPAGATGAQGPKGDKGDTGATGPAGAAGKTPVKGTDYWTAADKQSMVNDVLAALPAAEGVSF